MPRLDQTFCELFDFVADMRGRSKAGLFLEAAISRYGLRHIAFAGVNFPNPNRGAYYLKNTYPDEWVDRYLARDYDRIDPVVRCGLLSPVPLDWASHSRDSKIVREFFGESIEFGLARQGISFSVRGPGSQIGLFNINADFCDREWAALRPFLFRDFQILATFFHNGVLGGVESQPGPDPTALSPRERECLNWAATGKTAWETSLIVGVSERCVRFHLDAARRKLNCLTKVQAAAKAIALGLITLS